MKKYFPVYVRVPLIFAIVLGTLELLIDSGDRPAFVKYPMVLLFLAVFLFFQIAVEIMISAIDTITYQLMTEEEKKKLQEEQTKPFTESAFYKNLLKKLTRTKSIEQEADVLLDHNYDGIRELDNVLPPWWVYLFYATIIFGAIYLFRFHIVGDYNQEQEFNTEMKEAQAKVDAYMKTAPDTMSKDKVTLLTDAPSLAAGKDIFTKNCIPCHRADAGGQIGPNLTDQYWINGGGIKNVFNTIMEGGRDGKGMVSWKATIKPSDIQKVASYVLSLQGSNPKNPKPTEPEAKEWKEEGAKAVVKDSAKVAVK